MRRQPVPMIHPAARSLLLLLLLGAIAPRLGLGEDRDLLEQAHRQKLVSVRTVYVDELSGADGSAQIRDMIIGSLHRARLFVITEDQEKADAYLRGTAEDLIYSESLSQRQGLNVRGSASRSRRDSGDSKYDFGSFGIGETDSTLRRERKHEAIAAVRLVLRNGEVIWSTVQESAGAKYRGAAADVAEKVAGELVAAFRNAKQAMRPAADSR